MGLTQQKFPETISLTKIGLLMTLHMLFMTHLTVSILLKNPGHEGTSTFTTFSLLFFFSLQVPPATSDPLAFISFSAKGATVNLAERRSVAIQNVDNMVFIQTDKPIYKPGQKGAEEFESASEL